MQAQLIRCPNCGQNFELTETLALPLVESVRADLGAKLQTAQQETQQAKNQLIKERAEHESARANLEAEVAERLAAKRPELEAGIRKAVSAEMAADVKAAAQENADLRKSLAEAQGAQLAAIRAQQEAERKAASIDLEVAKKVAAETAAAREQAMTEVQETARLKLAEKDLVIERLSATADELQTAQQETRQAKNQLIKERAEHETARANLEAEVAERLAAKRPELEASIRKAVSTEMAADVKAAEQENADLRKSLAEAQGAQLAAIKAQQEAERKASSIDLEVAKKVAAETAAVREQAMKEAQEAARLKLAEKDLVIERLSATADELKRKADQGSQRDQGEVAEIELEEILTAAFPWDEISEIKSGVRGADVLQRIKTGAETVAGLILWERKRTQGWGNEWLLKAKQDMLREKADVVVIVSDVVPKGVELFDFREDVWIVSPRCAVPVAKALRAGLLETANARRASEGRKTNAERAYDYLVGPEFVQRLKGIAEPFVQMQGDLEAERRAMNQRWARRQKQIDRVLEAAFGMRGDIEALAGSDLPGLDSIEMKALEATGSSDEVSQ